MLLPNSNSRRDFLRLSLAGGLCWAASRQGFAAEPGSAHDSAKAKASVLVFLEGSSHIDMFDPKPGQDTGGRSRRLIPDRGRAVQRAFRKASAVETNDDHPLAHLARRGPTEPRSCCTLAISRRRLNCGNRLGRGPGDGGGRADVRRSFHSARRAARLSRPAFRARCRRRQHLAQLDCRWIVEPASIAGCRRCWPPRSFGSRGFDRGRTTLWCGPTAPASPALKTSIGPPMIQGLGSLWRRER
jgi:hypothetical protein